MKKSILFSSIATTCCLLIQTSASAEWSWHKSSMTRLEGSIDGVYSYSSSLNYKGRTSLDLNTNYYPPPSPPITSTCSSEFGWNTFESISNVNSDTWGFPGHQATSKVSAETIFTIEENSNINLNAYINGNGSYQTQTSFGVASSNISIILDKQSFEIGSAWTFVDSFGLGASTGWYGYSHSRSGTFYLSGSFNYRISTEISNESRGYAGAESTFNMSLTPVPAPAASALFVLAGLVSRRRRA